MCIENSKYVDGQTHLPEKYSSHTESWTVQQGSRGIYLSCCPAGGLSLLLFSRGAGGGVYLLLFRRGAGGLFLLFRKGAGGSISLVVQQWSRGLVQQGSKGIYLSCCSAVEQEFYLSYCSAGEQGGLSLLLFSREAGGSITFDTFIKAKSG